MPRFVGLTEQIEMQTKEIERLNNRIAELEAEKSLHYRQSNLAMQRIAELEVLNKELQDRWEYQAQSYHHAEQGRSEALIRVGELETEREATRKTLNHIGGLANVGRSVGNPETALMSIMQSCLEALDRKEGTIADSDFRPMSQWERETWGEIVHACTARPGDVKFESAAKAVILSVARQLEWWEKQSETMEENKKIFEQQQARITELEAIRKETQERYAKLLDIDLFEINKALVFALYDLTCPQHLQKPDKTLPAIRKALDMLDGKGDV